MTTSVYYIYNVSPATAARVIELGRQLGAPVRKGAATPDAFDRALIQLIGAGRAIVKLRQTTEPGGMTPR